MTTLDFFDRLEEQCLTWSRVIALTGLACLIVISMLTALDVGLRWIFSAPIPGAHDISEMLIIVVISSCFPAAVLQRGNITIRFLGTALGPSKSAILDCVGSFAVLMFFAIVAWQMVLYMGDMIDEGILTFVLSLPTWPAWVVSGILFSCCFPLQCLIFIGDLIRTVMGRPRIIESEAL